MPKSIKSFAKIALAPGNSSIVKSGFLAAYARAVSEDPSLIDAGTLKLVVRLAETENPRHVEILTHAFCVINLAIESGSEMAFRITANCVAKAYDGHNATMVGSQAAQAYEIIREKHPKLVGREGPDVPEEKKEVLRVAPVAQP